MMFVDCLCKLCLHLANPPFVIKFPFLFLFSFHCFLLSPPSCRCGFPPLTARCSLGEVERAGCNNTGGADAPHGLGRSEAACF